jgi:hypothetical protein
MSDDQPVENTPTELPSEPNPDESPFAVQAIEGIPFPKDSEEARAIREVIEQADRERAAQTQS